MQGFDPEKITFFGRTDARGKNVSFGIKAKDRQRHMYVIGKTGMGKSTLLENMAVQDIQNGEGMAFIDPHGSAAETLLNYIPPHRVNDVVYFAPFDMNNPVAFNIMEDVGADKRHLVVSGLMSVFKKIWVDAWSARMEYILTNALLALIEYPDSTLLSVNKLFADKAYRKQVVDYIKDPAVKAFWTEEFAGYTDRFAAEALPAIQNKIGQFTGNPLIRNIIGQPKSSFDIRKLMDEKKILIMNLSKGLVGETNANLLGSMLTTRIYLAAMSRADLAPEKMKAAPNFYFYVDEFQSFANATFANILSEARKYHLNLTIAHQYIEQMEEEVRNAVFGNVGTIVSFRVGPFDAEVLESIFTPQFLATDIVNLSFAQIYLTLMIDGIGSAPFSATTLPPIAPPEVSCKDMVIRASRRQFAREREEVEKAIALFHAPVEVPKKESFARIQSDRQRFPEKKERTGDSKQVSRQDRKLGNQENRNSEHRFRTEKENKREGEDVSLAQKKRGFEEGNGFKNENDVLEYVAEHKERTQNMTKNAERMGRIERDRTGKERVERTVSIEENRPVFAERSSGQSERRATFEASHQELRSLLESTLKHQAEKERKEKGVLGKEESRFLTNSPGKLEIQKQPRDTVKQNDTLPSNKENVRPPFPRTFLPLTLQKKEANVLTRTRAHEKSVPNSSLDRHVPVSREYSSAKAPLPPISPKTLERMMRVTGEDRPPF